MDDESNSIPRFEILGPAKLRIFFLDHLNHIYCAKSHLVERLPEIEEEAYFKDLKNAIIETREDVEKQILRMDEIYTLLEAKSSFGNCGGLIGMVEDAFLAIQLQSKSSILRDLSILFYMQNIESVEMSSFQILQVAAVKLKNNYVTQLLKENFDEAKADRALLLLIAAKYITG